MIAVIDKSQVMYLRRLQDIDPRSTPPVSGAPGPHVGVAEHQRTPAVSYGVRSRVVRLALDKRSSSDHG